MTVMDTNTMPTNPDLFKKQTVNRPPATSILTSLLSSPKTTCSSPELTSPSDIFSECDLASRSNSPSPQALTPPRKSCVSFAAAQPKSSPVTSRPKSPKPPSVTRSPALKSRTPTRQPPAKASLGSPSKESGPTSDTRPVLGSIFDEFGDSNASPVFHDYYRSGQPKKLVDDCLKKEKELRIPTILEEGENSFRDDTSNIGTDIDDDDGEDEDDDNNNDDNGDDSEFNNEDDTDDEDSGKECNANEGARDSAVTKVNGRSQSLNYLQIDINVANCTLLSYNIYTPSRDVIDNFVPGTLDEDQVDALEAPSSPQSVHDIDPTYPSDEDDDAIHHSEQSSPVLVSPVRFISRQRSSPPLQLAFSASQIRSKGPSRTSSLPWTQKRYTTQLKRPSPRLHHSDQPRCAAIAIAKSVDHKKHHRREKKDDSSESHQKKGIGAEAMAAMAKQLTSRNHPGLLAVSV